MSFSLTVEMNQKQCPTCGIVFCMPAGFEERCRNRGSTWYCPSGHPITPGQSEEQKKIAELTALLAAEKRTRVECEAKLRAATVKPVETPALRRDAATLSLSRRIWTPERRAEHSRKAKERWQAKRERKAS